MGEYAFMKVLDIWYDKIELQQLLNSIPKGDVGRKRMEQRIELARGRTAADFDFPKLAEHVGAAPKIRDNPPLIYHILDQTDAVVRDMIDEAFARYRESLPEHVRVLFDRFVLFDVAMKVVGVGSVGTMCLVALFMAGDADPLFLQIKQANASVLEPFAGQSLHENHGERVVVGQRLMQSASDSFLGWTQGRLGRHFYVRQLRDMKLSAIIEGMDPQVLRNYAEACGWALARAHARSGDAAMISGYMGSSRTFEDAVCDFAVDYADQAERDHMAFVTAVREGRVEAVVDA
jgi:uncharacterized protein (DUF2252 family)